MATTAKSTPKKRVTPKKGVPAKKAATIKTAPATKAPAKKTVAPASWRAGSPAAAAKYDQPGAPWWKKIPLPTPK